MVWQREREDLHKQGIRGGAGEGRVSKWMSILVKKVKAFIRKKKKRRNTKAKVKTEEVREKEV